MGRFAAKIGAVSMLAFVVAAIMPMLSSIWLGSVGVALGAGMQREACVNESIRSHEVYAAELPDCRAYEQVSPVEKNQTDALGRPGAVQASPLGNSVTFFSIVPLPDTASAAEFPTYLSTREDGGWSTQGLLPLPAPASAVGGASVMGLTEDLGETILSAPDPTSGGADFYVRDNALEESLQLLASGGEVSYADATPDGSRILFEDEAQLDSSGAPVAPVEKSAPKNLYEWDAGRVSLVASGAVAGPGGPELGSPGLGGTPGGATSRFYTEDTLSEDGSRVFFSDVKTGQIFVRENGGPPIEVSQSQRNPPEAPSPAYWRGATPDGQYVFFTSEARLTDASTATAKHPDLYRFSVGDSELIDLTEAASEGGGVVGTLGISDDGSRVYFVANGVLTLGGNAEGHSPEVGADNLYEWQEGVVIFVARLNNETDLEDWASYCRCNGGGAAGGERTSGVTPSDAVVLFASEERLTGYDNAGFTELYLYDAAARKITCVSCNPSGAPATHEAVLVGGAGDNSPILRNSYTARNLSASGNRVFFQTEEALVPRDVNGQMDVYEWEREGTGSCGEGTGGCLYLISTGQSSDPSYFGEASAEGEDVFFFTRQALVSQDQDNNADLYDARIGGGFAAQNEVGAAPCSSEQECRGPVSVLPIVSAPASADLAADGNLTPMAETPSVKKAITRAKKKVKRRARKRSMRKGKAKGQKHRS